MKYFTDQLARLYRGDIKTIGEVIVVGVRPPELADLNGGGKGYVSAVPAGTDCPNPGHHHESAPVDIREATRRIVSAYDASCLVDIRNPKAVGPAAGLLRKYGERVSSLGHVKRYVLDPSDAGQWDLMHPIIQENGPIGLYGKSLDGDQGFARSLIDDVASMLGSAQKEEKQQLLIAGRQVEITTRSDPPSYSAAIEVRRDTGINITTAAAMAEIFRSYPGEVKIRHSGRVADGKRITDMASLSLPPGSKVEVVMERVPGFEPEHLYGAIMPLFGNPEGKGRPPA